MINAYVLFYTFENKLKNLDQLKHCVSSLKQDLSPNELISIENSILDENKEYFYSIFGSFFKESIKLLTKENYNETIKKYDSIEKKFEQSSLKKDIENKIFPHASDLLPFSEEPIFFGYNALDKILKTKKHQKDFLHLFSQELLEKRTYLYNNLNQIINQESRFQKEVNGNLDRNSIVRLKYLFDEDLFNAFTLNPEKDLEPSRIYVNEVLKRKYEFKDFL